MAFSGGRNPLVEMGSSNKGDRVDSINSFSEMGSV